MEGLRMETNALKVTAPAEVTLPSALIAKIDSIESVMLTAHPRLPGLLREIHSVLKNDPAIVTLLTEEQIGKIVTGLAAHTNVELANSTVKKSTTKPLKKLTIDDL
jgi:hypothetical protein